MTRINKLSQSSGKFSNTAFFKQSRSRNLMQMSKKTTSKQDENPDPDSIVTLKQHYQYLQKNKLTPHTEKRIHEASKAIDTQEVVSRKGDTGCSISSGDLSATYNKPSDQIDS